MSLDALEPRRHLSVTRDSAGWTVVSAAADTRIIYVSSSGGNDANDGLSTSSAVASLTRAKSLIRDGSADWMLLKRGDTFSGGFGSWNKRGRSAQEPLYVGAYGVGERPLIDSGTTYGINTVSSSQGTNNLVFQSLSLTPGAYNHSNGAGDLAGFRLTQLGSNILIEDCKVSGYKDNIVIAGEVSTATVTGVTVRRSQVLDAHYPSTSGNSQGIYIAPFARNVTIEENVIDHNGWRQGVSADRVDKNHNIYSQTGAQGVLVRDNIISQASFYGLKFNSGGTATGNLFVRNSESVYLERASTISDNVITEAVDMPGFAGWGVGINTQKSPQATIRHNLITKVLSATASGVAGIQLYNNGTPFSGVVEQNIVYNWRNALFVNTPGNGPGSVIIRNNQVDAVFSDSGAGEQRSAAVQSAITYQNNRYSAGSRTSTANRINGQTRTLAQWVATTGEVGASFALPNYPDASRDVGRYAASIGRGTSFESFIAAARGQYKAVWSAALTATSANQWLWAGFGQGTTGQPVTVTSATFNAGSLPLTVDLTFSGDIGGTLAAGDVTVMRVSDGAAVGVASVATGGAASARITLAGGALVDGNYRLTLPAGSVGSGATAMTDAFNFDFFLFAGDFNRDRRINIDDFGTMAINFNRAGTISEGDADYSGAVDISDFAIVATRFNQQLPAGASAARMLPLAQRSNPFAVSGTLTPERIALLLAAN